MKTTTISKEKEQNYVNLSRELIQMTAVERYKFLHEHTDVPANEKAMVLDTFISLLEEIEDYETCEGLYQLRLELIAA